MLKRFIIIFTAVCAVQLNAEVTLRQCLEQAERNYPAIRKAGLLDATLQVDLADINRNWLPRIGIYGQGTGQNAVPAWPAAFSGMLAQMGQEMEGLGKLQYKVGADLQQTLWDGGASAAARRTADARKQMEQDAVKVEMYAVRQRVESLYFAILLTESQVRQAEATFLLLQSLRLKVSSLLDNGIATRSDLDMVDVQLLSLGQTINSAIFATKGYRDALALFTGTDLHHEPLVLPQEELDDNSATANLRPELGLIRSRALANKASLAMKDAAMMPKAFLFAQAFYGYPGLNYFDSMMSHRWSFNVVAGVKVQWDADALYSRKANRRRLSIDNDDLDVQAETFLFNCSLQERQQSQAIAGLRKVIDDDRRIVELRHAIRVDAENRYNEGMTDMHTFIDKINDESMAKLTQALHDVQLSYEICKLKYITNQ